MNAIKIVFCALILLLVQQSCKEKYNPPVKSPSTGYLVVEGFINSGREPTTITLSRSTPLDTSYVIYETGARVMIESNNNESFSLNETGNGIYTSDSLSLNNSEQYRLHIFTSNGSEYISDFTPVKYTPPIDSVNWTRDEEGIHLFLNTHDANNNTKFYQWQYEETWEFHSAFHSSLVYVGTEQPDNSVDYTLGNRLPDGSVDTTIFKCWHYVHSTSILIGSTEKLSTDKVFLPLFSIPSGAQQLSVLYSLIVRQHALSKDSYDFLYKMKKNTEQLGTIFDAQPSDLSGNIHCVTHPSELVVGYMEVSQLQAKRIYISSNDVPGWNYRQSCTEVQIAINSDSIKAHGLGLIPTSAGFNTYNASEPTCVDCTLTGSNIRPPFWP